MSHRLEIVGKMGCMDQLVAHMIEAEKGMTPGKPYDTSNMQIIWMQIGREPDWFDHLKISKDHGKTWEEPPSIDTGKWYYDEWLFLWVL